MKTVALLASLIFISFVLPASAADAKPTHKKLDLDQFEKLRSDKANVVLDVRSKKEFDAGHIPGAINLDVRAPDFATKAAKLDKNKTYLVHCAVGPRGTTACDKLAALGFEKLTNLEGGYKAWSKAGHKGEK
jgi:rhodanese-related sulfurtransferase